MVRCWGVRFGSLCTLAKETAVTQRELSRLLRSQSKIDSLYSHSLSFM